MDQVTSTLSQAPQMISFSRSDLALCGEHLNEPARSLRSLQSVRKNSAADRFECCPRHEKSWLCAACGGECLNSRYRLPDNVAGHSLNCLADIGEADPIEPSRPILVLR